jgi:uncharacterized protein YhhL (DUF1145 family)
MQLRLVGMFFLLFLHFKQCMLWNGTLKKKTPESGERKSMQFFFKPGRHMDACA